VLAQARLARSVTIETVERKRKSSSRIGSNTAS
jgi:hypothetical protein